MRLLLLLCLSFYVVFAKHEQYDGYVVYEIYPKTLDDMRIVNQMVNELGFDIWSFATPNNPGQIFVSKPQREVLEKSLKSIRVPYKASVENIRELLEKEDEKLRAGIAKRNYNSTELTFDHIYDYEEVAHYLAAIAAEYPDTATLVNAGTSLEGRPIQVLQISTTGFQDYGKPIIFLQSLLHAREWVTLPPTLYAIHKLLNDLDYTELLNHIDWIIMPIANPDGYVWSHTDDRFWRKNRRSADTASGLCVGVDLNRNFNIDWGKLSSSNPCSNTYHGTGPTSEPETLAISRILERYEGRYTMYEDLHSTGSMILYGWGNGTLVSNALILNLVGVKMAQAIDEVKWENKPNYRVGNTLSVIGYTVSGGSSDYAQFRGVPYSYTYELPAYLNASTAVERFLVDPEFIEQAAIETWEGLVAGAKYLISV